MVDGVLHLSETYVKYAFYRKQSLEANNIVPERLYRAIEKCEILTELNKQRALPFALHEMVKGVPAPDE